MTVQLGHVLVEKAVEDTDILLESREIVWKETVKSAHDRLFDLLFGQKPAEEPEWLFFATSADHKDKTRNEIHGLTVTNFLIINAVGLQDVPERLLSDSTILSDCEVRVRGERPVQVLVNRLEPLVVLALLQLIFVQSFALLSDVSNPHKLPG